MRMTIASELIAQIEACVTAAEFATPEAFILYCVEKELKLRRETEEKALAERLRGLGYLE